MMKFLLPLIAAAVLLGSTTHGALLISNEDQLVSNLISNFLPVGKIARPEPITGGNVSVDMALFLIRVWPDRSGEVTEIDVWINMIWKDPRLSWDPKKFGNLTNVALPHDSVWLPDIRPFSSKEYIPDKETASRVVVSCNSTIIYVLPAKLRHRCSVAANRSLTCSFVLGSWVYSSKQVDLVPRQPKPIDISEFQDADRWNVTKAEAKLVVKRYPCCPESYQSMEYTIELSPKKMPKGGKNKKKRDD